jgi:hypothetical protein
LSLFNDQSDEDGKENKQTAKWRNKCGLGLIGPVEHFGDVHFFDFVAFIVATFRDATRYGMDGG